MAKEGAADESFRLLPDEHIKWELRRLYDRQRNHYAECGEFTRDSALLMGEDSWTIRPHIEMGGIMFEISAPSTDGQAVWYIREDGNLWKGNDK
ncbi:hypothetical protein KZ483_05845 [Paenibacillus sp. sptzw28]|uniref:hypothetical protein n=1 Tax=Paenibacillus sp. sptzw28 TaxID=715179 RepID=UPI001C6EE526|nr:hypothetical protein [Paenibacillus sp. sptzw28]QYR22496.1 hypothetical protein KZ483_05845 [Paenibacillus sp. sptzw28]